MLSPTKPNPEANRNTRIRHECTKVGTLTLYTYTLSGYGSKAPLIYLVGSLY